MAVVLSQIAEAFVRIEQHVLVPAVGDAIDVNGAPFKADDLVIGSANFPARSERNQRLVLRRVATLNFCRICRFGSLASRMEWQLSQTIVTALLKERTASAAPQSGQFSALTCGFAGGAPALMTSPRRLRRFLSARSSNSTISPR